MHYNQIYDHVLKAGPSRMHHGTYRTHNAVFLLTLRTLLLFMFVKTFVSVFFFACAVAQAGPILDRPFHGIYALETDGLLS